MITKKAVKSQKKTSKPEKKHSKTPKKTELNHKKNPKNPQQSIKKYSMMHRDMVCKKVVLQMLLINLGQHSLEVFLIKF
jgi:hypothetical protein